MTAEYWGEIIKLSNPQ